MNLRRLQFGPKFLGGQIAAAVVLLGIAWLTFEQPLFAVTKIHSVSASPLTITFLGTDPDSPTLTVPATILFRTTGGSTARSWSLSVQAASGPNMINCPSTIPVDKIQVSCVSSISDNDGTAACAAPFNLSTGLQLISSGTEGTGNANPYETVINFTFQDSWRYIATDTSCTVNLNYQIIAD
ncbi:MAG: hypothetical protein HYX73_05325 [Acidobacteria bacterium]|nr:hypothetical protein [Acidobacteriota bacterium]